MLITGEKTYLGPIQSSDAQVVQEWMNEIELCRLFWLECPLPKNIDEVMNWINGMNNGAQTGLLAIRRLEDGELIGMFTLRKLSRLSGSVRFGSAIWPPELWSQGLGTDARQAFLNYAFKQMGLRRVYGSFAAYNIASRRSHEKLGAEVSVVNRDAVYMDGRFHDLYQYTYQRETYKGLKDIGETVGEESVCPAVCDEIFMKKSIERTYADFYGRPSPGGADYEFWEKEKILGSTLAGQYIFIMDYLRRSCELLLFPDQWKKLDDKLLHQAVEIAFKEYNIHRIQVCLPGSAEPWREVIEAEGFQYEGKLNRLIFAEGYYQDLLFYGINN